MNTLTMLEFRKNAAAYLKKLSTGHSFILTHRGKPVAILSPCQNRQAPIPPDDPALNLSTFAVDGPGGKCTSRKADQLIYGQK
jgi:antitoxin (DNA-binding transcriptional repressor) of toxin-antitoxin stability system